MTAIFFDSPLNDEQRRDYLYNGNLFIYSVIPNAKAFAEFARELIEEAFHPYDPQTAQHMSKFWQNSNRPLFTIPSRRNFSSKFSPI
jgi:hypothetical protein